MEDNAGGGRVLEGGTDGGAARFYEHQRRDTLNTMIQPIAEGMSSPPQINFWYYLTTALADGIPSFLGTAAGIWLAAFLAMKNWRTQQVKKQMHDASVQYVKGLIVIEDMLPSIRNPLVDLSMAYGLTPESDAELERIQDPDLRNRRAHEFIIQHRLREIQRPFHEVSLANFELEAAGDTRIRTHTIAVSNCLIEMQRAARIVLEAERGDPVPDQRAVAARRVLWSYADADGQGDEFGDRFGAAIKAARESAGRHLLRTPS